MHRASSTVAQSRWGRVHYVARRLVVALSLCRSSHCFHNDHPKAMDAAQALVGHRVECVYTSGSRRGEPRTVLVDSCFTAKNGLVYLRVKEEDNRDRVYQYDQMLQIRVLFPMQPSAKLLPRCYSYNKVTVEYSILAMIQSFILCWFRIPLVYLCIPLVYFCIPLVYSLYTYVYLLYPYVFLLYTLSIHLTYMSVVLHILFEAKV